MGSGVYLTTISPKTAKKWIALNNYDGATLQVDRMLDTGKSCSSMFQLKPTSITLASSERAPNMFGASSEPF